MYVIQTPKYQRTAPDGAQAVEQPEDAPRKWAARKTLAFVLVVSSFLWTLIIYAANQI